MVEDDEVIARGLVAALVATGLTAEWSASGREAIERVGQEHPDLVILDLGLPDVDGVDVCRAVRTRSPATRVMILTARREEIDVVVGLDAGADDYVVKPFRLAELLARVRALLRRDAEPPAPADGRVTVGDLTVDAGARRVFINGDEIDLRPKEFDLLALLVQQSGQVVTREKIMEKVWDEHWFGSTKTLDMHMSVLRKKIAASSASITTLRHVGYRFDP